MLAGVDASASDIESGSPMISVEVRATSRTGSVWLDDCWWTRVPCVGEYVELFDAVELDDPFRLYRVEQVMHSHYVPGNGGAIAKVWAVEVDRDSSLRPVAGSGIAAG